MAEALRSWGALFLDWARLVIQIIIAFIHLLLSKIPLIFYVDMWIELSRLSLGKQIFTLGSFQSLCYVQGSLSSLVNDIHGGLAPEKQLQTLRLTVHAAVVQGRISQGCLLVQVPTVLYEEVNQMERCLVCSSDCKMKGCFPELLSGFQQRFHQLDSLCIDLN